MTSPSKLIAFQGEPGAYSHQACRDARPDLEALPCRTFEDVIETVRGGQADLAMLPVENSTYGRVADIHHLLPESGLHIIDEAFVRVHISLLALPGTPLDQITDAMSHTVLLGQCRGFLRQHGIRGQTGADTAGSARIVAEQGQRHIAALAAPLAGEIYGLDRLADEIEDRQNNTTRFLLMSREPDYTRRANRQGEPGMITSFVFRVRNIPAALYKAMGGFATNGVNMTKLESYMVDGVFTATQFYADIEGHPDDANVKRALDELRYFTSMLNILGVYPADPLRAEQLSVS
ncbi:prephenate dehydratase [Paracoccus sp. SCSIO 75233]|uniref:prephenate dehydratase n=1 Tax=Paracoccus sp. SCSIO 75233 TaxID=3017782 RepID=UPI0022F0018E|nr:prephenate dehydratase [Paracoccus sp. SCSIO 75233]WBU52101.1 prephenate dehydratase [Paracoccus sp. SCSIO 75233]